METEKFKKAMNLHGITYSELGAELDRSPNTVKQRLSTESTFHKHKEVYSRALIICAERKDKERKEALKELGK